MDFRYIKSFEYLTHLYFATLTKAVYNITVTKKMYNVCPVSTWTNRSHHSSGSCTGRITWSDTRERLTRFPLHRTWPGSSTSS